MRGFAPARQALVKALRRTLKWAMNQENEAL